MASSPRDLGNGTKPFEVSTPHVHSRDSSDSADSRILDFWFTLDS